MAIRQSWKWQHGMLGHAPGVLFAKQRCLHRQSALQDVSSEFYVVVLFVEGVRGGTGGLDT